MIEPTPQDLVASAHRLLDLLLRYVVAGGAAVLVFGALQTPPFAAITVEAGSGKSEISSWLLLLSISVVGPAIYSIHKAILHPILLVLEISALRRVHNVRHGIRKVLLRLEDCRFKWDQEGWKWMPNYESWTAQLHFLYCAGWGMSLALFTHELLSTNIVTTHKYATVSAIVIVLASAIVSDVRCLYRQVQRAYNEESG